MNHRPAQLAAALMIVLVLVIATGCAADPADGAGDAPIDRAETSGWVVLSAPDRYPNVAFRCMGVNGIYVARNADASTTRTLVVIPNDPQCAGAAK